jgi:hypothetical protein
MRKKDKIYNLPRNKDLIDAMGNMEVFRSSEVVDIGSEMGISKRTVDSIVHILTEEEMLTQVRRGLYVTSDAKVNAALFCRIARASSKNPKAVLSFDSAISSSDSPLGASIMVSSGKVGVMKTSLGDISFFNVSQRLIDKVVNDFGESAVYSSPTRDSHTPELGLALCCYLESTGRSNFVLSENVDLKSVDLGKASLIMKGLGIPQEKYAHLTGEKERNLEVNNEPSPF